MDDSKDQIYHTVGPAISYTKTAIKGSKIGATFLKFISKFNKPAEFAEDLKRRLGEPFMKAASLCINGCFLPSTPVWLANQSLVDNGKILAIASLPFVTVPIQSANLLDYAVAHRTVNSTYGLTVSDDTYAGLFEKDPYTSDQQRSRDQYNLNDADWQEVILHQENGSSVCKFALHQDFIDKNGYELNKIVTLNLPEQSINGPFKITSIKHILPQKIPTEENLKSDFDFRPITAIFTHESNNVWVIKFDNGDSLGVTYVHPIFTQDGWKAAGEIKAGDEVLTYTGYSKAVSNNQLSGTHLVYNLEVKDLHNFLVGSDGVVVHNSYVAFIKGIWPKFTKKPFPNKKWVSYLEESGKDEDDHKEVIQLEELGELLNRRFIHLKKDINKKDFPTIDGLFEDDGLGITLKKLEVGSGANKVATAASTILANIESNFKNQDGHKNNHIKQGIIAYIDASEHNASKILEQIKKTRNANDNNYAKYKEYMQYVKKYYYKANDGKIYEYIP